MTISVAAGVVKNLGTIAGRVDLLHAELRVKDVHEVEYGHGQLEIVFAAAYAE